METPNLPENKEIKTIQDVMDKMLPEFSNNDSKIDPYLKKRFDKLYQKLSNNSENNEKIDDIIDELNDIWNSYNKTKKLEKQAMLGARCAIIQRNLSRNNCQNLIFPTSQLEKFILFCGVNKADIKERGSIFKNLFIRNYEEMKNHHLNIIYQNLRKNGKSPVEAIQSLPRGKLALQNTLTGSCMLPGNDEIMQGSKMGDTEYCLGRVNTILGIIALNEGIDYLDKHFKYVEVIKDGLEDEETQSVPMLNRDDAYLNDILNYEDPHQILLFIDDNGTSIQLDTNLIALKQLGINTDVEHITKIYKGNMSDIAYEIYFLNYLNFDFYNLSSVEEKNKILNYVDALNEKYGGIPTLLKRLIAYANDLDNVDFENKKFDKLKDMVKEYPCIENTLSYQMELNNGDETLMNEFIHRKYGPQFKFSDIKAQFGIN